MHQAAASAAAARGGTSIRPGCDTTHLHLYASLFKTRENEAVALHVLSE